MVLCFLSQRWLCQYVKNIRCHIICQSQVQCWVRHVHQASRTIQFQTCACILFSLDISHHICTCLSIHIILVIYAWHCMLASKFAMIVYTNFPPCPFPVPPTAPPMKDLNLTAGKAMTCPLPHLPQQILGTWNIHVRVSGVIILTEGILRNMYIVTSSRNSKGTTRYCLETYKTRQFLNVL